MLHDLYISGYNFMRFSADSLLQKKKKNLKIQHFHN